MINSILYLKYLLITKTARKLHSKRNKMQRKQKNGIRKVSNQHVQTYRKKMSLQSPEIPLKK